jgi:hypothetical protein
MIAERVDSERFRGFRVNFRRRKALSGTAEEGGPPPDRGIAALPCPYHNVVVIIRTAGRFWNGLRCSPDIARIFPCGGRRLELGFRGWRVWVAL